MCHIPYDHGSIPITIVGDGYTTATPSAWVGFSKPIMSSGVYAVHYKYLTCFYSGDLYTQRFDLFFKMYN